MRKKISDESRKNISVASKLAWRDPNRRKRLSEDRLGGKHPFFGKYHTEEAKAKMRLARSKRVISQETRKKAGASHKKRWAMIPIEERSKYSPMLGKHHSIETRNKISRSHMGICHTEETLIKLRGRTGERSGVWKGGTSYLPYCNKFDDARKKACRNFFNNSCLACGIHETENIIKWGTGFKQVNLHIHHIDHNKGQGCNGLPFNLVPLCTKCHGKENSKNDGFREYINKTLELGFDWGIWSRKQYEQEVMYSGNK